MGKKPLILVTNDDGYRAKGIESLISVARKFGEVVVVAPEKGQSGKSHAITIDVPLRLNKLAEEKDFLMYSCNGTPVDCVKLALNQVVDREPDLVVSGINHGSNASVSVIYSGTMAAAIEGGMNGVKSIGFSCLDFASDADFSAAMIIADELIGKVLKDDDKEPICLNVNIPKVSIDEIQGVKICRQAKGAWKEEFEKRNDTRGGEYYWLTGYFENYEPNAEDTDEWCLKNNYISVVPVKVDLTNFDEQDKLKKWNLRFENEKIKVE